jgi:hypothetical protein
LRLPASQPSEKAWRPPWLSSPRAIGRRRARPPECADMGPLAGVKVLELAQIMAGPTCNGVALAA